MPACPRPTASGPPAGRRRAGSCRRRGSSGPGSSGLLSRSPDGVGAPVGSRHEKDPSRMRRVCASAVPGRGRWYGRVLGGADAPADNDHADGHGAVSVAQLPAVGWESIMWTARCFALASPAQTAVRRCGVAAGQTANPSRGEHLGEGRQPSDAVHRVGEPQPCGASLAESSVRTSSIWALRQGAELHGAGRSPRPAPRCGTRRGTVRPLRAPAKPRPLSDRAAVAGEDLSDRVPPGRNSGAGAVAEPRQPRGALPADGVRREPRVGGILSESSPMASGCGERGKVVDVAPARGSGASRTRR
jgi:hypothetical protein